MALINCKECGNEISNNAKVCPKCGAKNINKGVVLATIATIFIFMMIFSNFIGGEGIGNTKDVTFNEYQKIKNGMSYREVVTIIGEEGEEVSSNRMEGIPGVMSSISTVMYQWANWDGSNMNAMFQNDRLMQKAQAGLK